MKTKFLMTSVAIAAIMAGSLTAAPAQAQTTEAFQAGSILVRGRLIDVIPLNSTSSVSAIGGHVQTTGSLTPEVDFSYFVTPNIAFELIAATTRHGLAAAGTAIGKVPVGSTWVLPPSLTVQYHFLPQSVINPYVGAGVNYTIFYNTHPAGGTVTKLKLDNNFGEVLQIGVDVNLGGRWYGNVDVKQIFLNTKAKINGGAVVAKTALNPTVVGIGVGYRF
jgi:outer membrane protein